tara:strand:+ start:6330 stop:7346 length:1017 start_codon:yes stop_codon:yes gene_type:complete
MAIKNLTVHLFLRKKTKGFNSIEMVFDHLVHFDRGYKNKLKTYMVPFKSVNPYSLWKNLTYCFQNKGQVNHVSGDIQYAALALGRKTLLTIHDVQSILNHPNKIKRFFLSLFWFRIPAMICKKISFISSFSRDEFLAHFPSYTTKTVVIPNPAPKIPKEVMEFKKSFVRDSKFDLEILQVGTKWNKNLDRIMEAIAGEHYQLNIVGKLSASQKTKLNTLGISYQNHVDIPYLDLLKLYASCDIVAFVSLYEGFGMPILEAQSIGVPVITSSRCAMPEITGEGGLIVDPSNMEEIRAAIKSLEDKKLRMHLIEKGKSNVSRFSVEKIYRQYESVYAEIA